MKIISDINKYKEKEELYIKVRDAEKRVLSDDELKQLPYLKRSGAIGIEWASRAKRFEQFIMHIHKAYKGRSLSILDIGCGNGWMTNKLYEQGHNVAGVDLNMTELTQAERVFGKSDKLDWLYADILNYNMENQQYDLILLSASCQYFSDISVLTQKLKIMLCEKGAIHLFDSMFYRKEEVPIAKERSNEYYKQLGFPQMGKYYFHHDIETLKYCGYKRVFPNVFSLKKGGLQWWKLTI